MNNSGYWSAIQVFERQKTEPVLLTNGCCEPTMGELDIQILFTALKLSYGPTRDEGGFYPLTDEEAQYIAEETAPGPYGGA